MFNRLIVTRTALLFGILAAFGCSSSDKNNQLASASLANTSKPNAALKDPRVKTETARQSESNSSLDALRRGESATTTAGSPLKEIYFAFDSYDLSPDARTALKSAADWLKQNPAAKAEIEGHCDDRGTTEYNLALGAKRAQAAKEYLLTLGVAGNRLSTTSYGEEIQICHDQSENCWQKNRRDRFVVISSKPGV